MHNSWIPLTTLNQIPQLIEQSHTQTVLIFKHSTTCGISAAAAHHLNSNFEQLTPNTPFYYLDLLAFREISNQIAATFQVIHQSPQVLLIKNGQAIFHTSHHAINIKTINNSITIGS